MFRTTFYSHFICFRRCFISNYYIFFFLSILFGFSASEKIATLWTIITVTTIRVLESRRKCNEKKKQYKTFKQCHNWIWVIVHIIRMDSIFNLFDWNMKCNRKERKQKTRELCEQRKWFVQNIQTDDIANFRTRKNGHSIAHLCKWKFDFHNQNGKLGERNPWILSLFFCHSFPNRRLKPKLDRQRYYGNVRRQFNESGQCNLEWASTASNFLLCKWKKKKENRLIIYHVYFLAFSFDHFPYKIQKFQRAHKTGSATP